MKPRAICRFFFLVFVFSLSTSAFAYEREIEILASDMSEKIANSGKAKIAVVDFTDLRGDVTELGRFISEELSVSLAGTGKGFKIVDRTHLKSILQEHKLSTTGLIDPTTARKLGEIAGVEALITGSLTPFGDTVRITVKVLDTETAEIIDAKKENIAKTEIIEELLAVTFVPRTNFSSTSSDRSENGQEDVSESDPKKENDEKGLPRYTENEAFKYTLNDIRRNGKNLTAFLLVESKADESIFQLSTSVTRIFDEFGNEYRPNADGVPHFEIGSRKSSSASDGNKLIKDIPTKVVIRFSNVNEKASKITLMEVGRTHKAQIRDIIIPN